MAVVDIEEYVKLVPMVKRSPRRCLWSSYDAEADTLYVSFKQPSYATDSELTETGGPFCSRLLGSASELVRVSAPVPFGCGDEVADRMC